MDFQSRVSLHEELQQKVCKIFDEHGLLYSRYGFEQYRLEKEIRFELQKCPDNFHAKFVRFMPDKLVIANGTPLFCEIKSVSQRYINSPHFSYELASHEIGSWLHKHGIKTFVVFHDLSTCWVAQIQFCKTYDGIESEYSRGSGTPFGLIRRNSPFFRKLPMFIEKMSVLEEGLVNHQSSEVPK